MASKKNGEVEVKAPVELTVVRKFAKVVGLSIVGMKAQNALDNTLDKIAEAAADPAWAAAHTEAVEWYNGYADKAEGAEPEAPDLEAAVEKAKVAKKGAAKAKAEKPVKVKKERKAEGKPGKVAEFIKAGFASGEFKKLTAAEICEKAVSALGCQLKPSYLSTIKKREGI